MVTRDNTQIQDFTEKFRKNRSSFIAAAATYVVALLVVCGWVANMADKDQSLISSKDIVREQIKAMANMGYWLGKAWFWAFLVAAILVGFLIKAAGEKKASVGKAAALAIVSVVVVVFWQGWAVVSKAALFKFLLGNWSALAIVALAIWLLKKFWPKVKNFFGFKDKPKGESEEKPQDKPKGESEDSKK